MPTRKIRFTALGAVLVLPLVMTSTLWAQGSLTPPGAPAATMKTLDQVYARLETRTAMNCYGESSSSVGMQATIANSCRIGLGTTNITYKYNMP